MNKADNLRMANELLDTVKSCGRNFFKTEGNRIYTSKFFIADSGQIYFVDEWSGKDICIRGQWIHSESFSHGGGLNFFIRALAKYIRTGRPQVYTGNLGNTWGYDDKSLALVNSKALEIGFAKTPAAGAE